MIDTFPLLTKPDWGLEDNVTADIVEQKLGDGYILRRPSGINYLRASWSPTWSFLGDKEADWVVSWLQKRLQLTPFYWTHPTSGRTYQVVCKSVSRSHADVGINVVGAIFEEDFNPV